MKKILIVEDDLVSRMLMKAILKELDGVEVHEADNGLFAVEKLKEQKFDLLLLDIVMPIMDGKDLLRHIKAKQEFSHMSIIATTTDIDSKNEMFELGVDDFVSKPIQRQLLIEKIKERLIY